MRPFTYILLQAKREVLEAATFGAVSESSDVELTQGKPFYLVSSAAITFFWRSLLFSLFPPIYSTFSTSSQNKLLTIYLFMSIPGVLNDSYRIKFPLEKMAQLQALPSQTQLQRVLTTLYLVAGWLNARCRHCYHHQRVQHYPLIKSAWMTQQ